MHASSSVHTHPQRPHHGLTRCGLWLSLGSLIAASWLCVRRTHNHRLHARPQPKSPREQVWEGEGGQNQQPTGTLPE